MRYSGYQHHNQTQTSLKDWVTKWMLFKGSSAATIRPLLDHKQHLNHVICKQGERSLLAFCLQYCAMMTIKSRELTSSQETKIFLDPFALFFATEDSRGNLRIPSSFLSPSPKSSFVLCRQDIMEHGAAVTQKAGCCPDYPKHREDACRTL